MKVVLPYLVVLLVRGEGSKTPVVVHPHEVDILRYQYGEDAVVVTEDKPPIKERSFDTADEYARLQQYYRGNADVPNPTAHIFRNLEDFEAAFKPTRRTASDDGGSGGNTGNQGSGGNTGANDAEKAELLAKAKSLGIKANNLWGIPKLQEAIAAAEKGTSQS